MTENESVFREDLRFRILRLLEGQQQVSYRDIARELNVSVGIVHYCLCALVDQGMVNIHNFRGPDNKVRYAYKLTPSGMAEKIGLTNRFLQRKLNEFEKLKAEIEAIQREVLADAVRMGSQP